ncbi:MAG: hypothetical protein ACOZHQ_07320 [Thermodesulfobacteriota bacterium]
MPLNLRLMLAVLLALGLAAPAAAGTIKITATAQATLENGRLSVNLSLVNQGDEAAQNLSLKLISAGQQIEVPGPAVLAPNQPNQTTLAMPVEPKLPGTYPAVVQVRFHDLNGYPFTSLANALYFHQRPTFAQVSGRGLPSQVAGEGEVSYEITALDQSPLKVAVRLFAPQELSLGRDRLELELAGRSRQTVSAPIKNFTALVGASYPVLALLEYDQDGLHHSAVAVAVVSLAPPPSFITRLTPYLYLAAGLLVALLAWLQWRRRKPA